MARTFRLKKALILIHAATDRQQQRGESKTRNWSFLSDPISKKDLLRPKTKI
jgi:hypothetical protein